MSDSDVDLTTTDSERENLPGLLTPGQRPYDPAEARETKRGQIALLLVGLLAGIAFLSSARPRCVASWNCYSRPWSAWSAR